MGNYATVSHVQNLAANRTISATSVPNASQVAQFCDETGALVDGILAQLGYTLPVATTATSALTYLQKLTAQGAWALTERAAPNSPHVDRAEKVWDDALAMLRDGKIEPVGLTRDTANLKARVPAAVGSPAFFRDMLL